MSGKKARKARQDERDNTFEFQRFATKVERRRQKAVETGDLRYLRSDVRGHYHLMFNALPNMKEGFETQSLAFREMKRIGEAHEPHVVWYEDGLIQLTNARLPNRTGHFQILIQVGECYRLTCPNIKKVQPVSLLLQQ